VWQVGRLLQPSVIFVDQAEKTFLKKVSKTDKSDPKRLKKDLPKLVKGIAPEDQASITGRRPKIKIILNLRFFQSWAPFFLIILNMKVILIGCSRCPWECDQKGLIQAYQKILYLPRPDYSYR
jgi:hypothetical protein